MFDRIINLKTILKFCINHYDEFKFIENEPKEELKYVGECPFIVFPNSFFLYLKEIVKDCSLQKKNGLLYIVSLDKDFTLKEVVALYLFLYYNLPLDTLSCLEIEHKFNLKMDDFVFPHKEDNKIYKAMVKFEEFMSCERMLHHKALLNSPYFSINT